MASRFDNYFPRRNIPNTLITNLDALLFDVHERFICLERDDFRMQLTVFETIFEELHQKMKNVDIYYNKFSCNVEFKSRIKTPDNYEMEILIGLPKSDLIFEPKRADFLRLKLNKKKQSKNKEQINRTAFEWKDDSNYLLNMKFLEWFQSVVNRALDEFESDGMNAIYTVEGICYVIKEDAEAAIIIENSHENFKLKCDLLPVLKMSDHAWPIRTDYRPMPENCRGRFWTLVGRPDKSDPNTLERHRSWRIALHIQEGKLMRKFQELKLSLRLVQRLCNTMDMTKITSYHLKSLALWEIIETDTSFWMTNSIAFLFKHMVGKLLEKLDEGFIPYFWSKDNLLQNFERDTLKEYVGKLRPFMAVLEDEGSFKKVAKYLLSPEEFKYYSENHL